MTQFRTSRIALRLSYISSIRMLCLNNWLKLHVIWQKRHVTLWDKYVTLQTRHETSEVCPVTSQKWHAANDITDMTCDIIDVIRDITSTTYDPTDVTRDMADMTHDLRCDMLPDRHYTRHDRRDTKNKVKRTGDRRSEAPNSSFIASVSDCNTIFHVTLVMCVIPVCQGYLLTNPYTRNTNSRWTRAPLVITSPQECVVKCSGIII